MSNQHDSDAMEFIAQCLAVVAFELSHAATMDRKLDHVSIRAGVWANAQIALADSRKRLEEMAEYHREIEDESAQGIG